jgi:medium-chain acyl-[acyl-carrier-protein] hydrolase
MTTDGNRWLRCFEKRPQAKVRLLCFAHAGGSAATYAVWHRDLPPEVELWALQLPGRDDRRTEARRVDIARLVAELVDALREVHDRPVALFGYSLGAIIAFEYARAVRGTPAGEPVHLFAAARRPPQMPLDVPIHALPDPQLIRETKSRYDGVPQVILDDPELLTYFLPIIRADLQLLESYRFAEEPALGCPITAFVGSTDPHAPGHMIDGWAAQTAGRFQAHVMPGGHFFIAQKRRAVLDIVAKDLARP